MLKAIILICSLAATPDLSACDSGNAVDVLATPVRSALPERCFMEGQAYLAGSSLAADMREGDRVKVSCVRETRP